MTTQAQPKDNYFVDSFHVNVGAGDGAIHIVSSGPEVARGRRRVERAIMLDAGRNRTRVNRSIDRTIDKIETLYLCQGLQYPGRTTRRLQFDHFVVSHWDGDHCEGVMEYLLQDLQWQFEEDFERTHQLPTQLLSARYVSNEPISYFDSPTPDFDFGLGQTVGGTGPWATNFYRTSLNNIDYLGIFLQITDGAGQVHDININRALILRLGADKLLGRNLFNPLSPSLFQNKINIRNIQNLVQYSPIVDPQPNPSPNRRGHLVFPAMYIVAVDRWALGEQDQAMTLTDKNRNSICTMIIWSNGPNGQRIQGGHVSHFSGGDIGFDMEEVIANWATRGPIRTPFKVTTMKLSHHGSRESSTLRYIGRMHPYNIWNSAGTMYNHPRWEILVFVYGLKVLAGRPLTRMFFSQYPYYLMRDRERTILTDVWFNDNELAGNSNFRQEHNNFWPNIQGDLERKSFLLKYDNWLRANPRSGWRQRQERLLLILETLMNDITPQLSGLVKSEVARNRNSEVTYVRFRSSPRGLYGQFADGRVECCYTHGTTADNTYSRYEEYHGIGLVGKVFPSAIDPNWRDKIATTLYDHMGIDVGGRQDLTRLGSKVSGADSEQITIATSPASSGVSLSPLGLHEESFVDITDNVHMTELSAEQLWPRVAALCGSSSQHEWDVLPRDSSSITGSEWDNLEDNDGLAMVYQNIGYLALDAGIADFPFPPVLLPKDHLLAGFLDAMRYRHITFSIPPDYSEPPAMAQIALADEDDWLRWFRQVLTMGQMAAKDDKMSQIYFKPAAWPILLKETVVDFGVSFLMALSGSQQPVRMVRLQFDQSSAPLTIDPLIDPDNTDRANKGASPASVKAVNDMLEKRITMLFGLNINALAEQNADLVKDLCGLRTTVGAVAELFSFQTQIRPAFKLLDTIELTLDTSPDSRNALWFRPGDEYNTVLRMQFKADITALNSWIGEWLNGVSIERILVVARKQSRYGYKKGVEGAMIDSELIFLLQARISSFSFDASVIVGEDRASFHLSTPSSFQTTTAADSILTAILEWLTTSLGVGDVDDKGKRSMSLDGFLGNDGADVIDRDSVIPRGVDIELLLDSEGGIEGIDQVSVTLEVAIKIGKRKGDGDEGTKGPVLFMLMFGWSEAEGVFLRGDLWCKSPKTEFDNYAKALPAYERFLTREPVTPLDPETQQLGLDIRTLIASKTGETVANIPNSIPTLIVKAGIEFSQKRGMSFTGEMRCAPRSDEDLKSDKKPPVVFLDVVTLSAAYSWDTRNRGLEVDLGVDVVLRKHGIATRSEDGSFGATGDEARFMAKIAYNRGGWKLKGGVQNLTVGHIAQFWDPHTRDEVMQYMGKLAIDYASIEYVYNDPDAPAPKQSSLKFEGQLSLGPVLKLKLEYVSREGKDWFFDARLSPKAGDSGTCTIQSVLESILDTKFEGMPPAIMTTTIPSMGSGNEAVHLFCAKEQDMTVFALMVNIGAISLWFLQFRRQGQRVKRIVKAAISDISVKVDLFGQTIKSPFEQFFFLWAQDSQPPASPKALNRGDDKAKEEAVRGITYMEYELLSKCLHEKGGIKLDDLFLYKPNKEKYDEMDTVIVAGCHLVAVGQGMAGKQGVVLDYVFGRPSKPSPPKLLSFETDRRRLSYDDCDRALLQMIAPADGGNGADDKPEKGAKAPLRVSRGPLSIENVSLYFKGGRIGVTLDATFLLGPVGLALMGFTINVPFDEEHNLSNPPTINDINFKLAGVAVSLDRPPLTLAGAFMYDDSDPNIKKYSGGLIFAFKPWQFEAMGVYATVPKGYLGVPSQASLNPPDTLKRQDPPTYTMLFIYCRLNGPLFSIGVVDVAGLIGGFGMNCDISLPTVEQVVDFPFIKNRNNSETEKESPIDTLKNLMASTWFRPAEGLYWAAAGVRCTAFQMLSIDAVLVVQFGGDNLKLGIYGIATLDAPSLLASVKFAHVELGIVVALDIEAGVFKLEAQLSPRSFVLAEACHLTGGIAFYSWFKADTSKNIAAGDWVLSLGGYHQAFIAPAHYPRPPRLGINWSLDKSLSITGEAYFAITPKVCMGGGRLHAALTLGSLYAYFDAFLDFLINMEPFFFQLQSRIAIGVRFTMDLWIVTIRISAEVSASLQVSGPPFGGVVHVDFWVFGFDVKFGASPSRPAKISIDKFWEMVLKTASTAGASHFLQAAPPSGERKGADQNSKLPPACLLTCESGLEPKPGKSGRSTEDSKKEDDAWLVRGGAFSFQASFQFAINKGTLKETLLKQRRCQKMDFFTNGSVRTDIYAKPMQLRSALTSNVTVSVSQTAPPPFQRHHGEQAVRAMGGWEDQKWRIEPIVKPASVSIWGQYDEMSDPSDPRSKGNNVSSLLNDEDSTIPLVMGLSIAPPKPEMSDDKIKSFNVVEDGKQYVFSGEPTPKFPGVTDMSGKAWTPRAASREESWTDVPEVWNGKGKGEKPAFDPMQVASMWASKMGFQDGQITGARPSKLLDRFENMVPALPMVAMGK